MLVLGFVLFAMGSVALFTGFGFFRKPGVRFWSVAPIWRASEYLYTPGIMLWWLSIAIFLVANIVLWMDLLQV